MSAAQSWVQLGELAVRFGCELHGDPALAVHSVATLQGGDGQLGFIANHAYIGELAATRLTAVVLEPQLAQRCPVAALVHRNPHAAYARIAALLHPPSPPRPGIHPTAIVAAGAHIDPAAEIGAQVIIEAGAVVGARCVVAAQSFIGSGASLGADTRLLQRVCVAAGTQIGQRCLLHPGAIVGSDGFGNAREGASWVKVPQLGRVIIGDDVEIGANTTIDRGALGDTEIAAGVRLDNQIQIGHNVRIGAHTAIAACTGIAGSTRIGARCMIGGGAGIGGQLTIGDDIVITGFGMVTRSISQPGTYSSVLPVEEVRLWRRIVARIKRLDALGARVRKLESAGATSAAGHGDDND
ncbi:MAG TPA: UDP-3-O-(3-hydroxymyristoyl)glucosamine N-acyltransferase [Steroidobacteraceae bacterium]|nr:UDP-3-O-(3-hydroxymyristoyl)glucosamine N-acyltransferase [Steroidobacteraceae bacterium]